LLPCRHDNLFENDLIENNLFANSLLKKSKIFDKLKSQNITQSYSDTPRSARKISLSFRGIVEHTHLIFKQIKLKQNHFRTNHFRTFLPSSRSSRQLQRMAEQKLTRQRTLVERKVLNCNF